MKSGILVSTIAAGALLAGAAWNAAVAQAMPEGRIYAFHSSPTGGCPGLDWHLVVGGNNTLGGMVAWDQMKKMATVTGTVNPTARTFTATAKEVQPPNHSTTLSGTVRADGWLVIDIGPIAGSACSNKMINVQWFTPSPSGGGGGN